MERESLVNAEEAAAADWAAPMETFDDAVDEAVEDDSPFVIRPSWNVMVAQLAGARPEPIRVSDFGRGSRVIARALSGDHEEHDLDFEDDEDPPRRAMH
jgi:hypothetical protein